MTRILVDAIRAGNIKLVEQLINDGIDINKSFLNFTPLLMAIYCNNSEITKILIDANANLDLRLGYSCCTNNFKETPLMLAIFKGHAEIVKLLIDTGCLKNEQDSTMSILEYAVRFGNINSPNTEYIIDMLIDAGCEMTFDNYKEVSLNYRIQKYLLPKMFNKNKKIKQIQIIEDVKSVTDSDNSDNSDDDMY